MKRTPKKLTLSKETLRVSDLTAATGGEDLATAACTQPLSACNCGDNPDLKAERVQ